MMIANIKPAENHIKRIKDLLFKCIEELSTEIILILDEKAGIYYINKYGAQLLGYPQYELIGKNWFDVAIPEDISEEIKGVFNRIVRGDLKEVKTYRNPIKRRDGSKRLIFWHNSYEKDKDGNIKYILSTGLDITNHIKLQKEREKALKLNENKVELLSNLNHTYKSELGAIKGFSEMILDGRFGDINNELRDAIQTIYDASKVMLQQATKVVHSGKLDLGEIQLEYTTFQIEELINSVVKVFQADLTKNNLKLEVELDPLLDKPLQADFTQLQDVLINLLSNAIKFTPNGKRIFIRVKRIGDMVQFCVEDEGIGIPQEKLEVIFDRFGTSQRRGLRGEPGTNLGLYMVKKIVQLHGGTINIESLVGVGSRVFFTIPYNP